MTGTQIGQRLARAGAGFDDQVALFLQRLLDRLRHLQLSATRLELDLLQAIRLALIMRIYILAAQLPRFTPQDGLSHSVVLDMALSLEIPEVVSIMRKAFPHDAKSLGGKGSPDFDEEASYRPRGIDDYARLETEILTSMELSYEFMREIGTGIAHHFGRIRLTRTV